MLLGNGQFEPSANKCGIAPTLALPETVRCISSANTVRQPSLTGRLRRFYNVCMGDMITDVMHIKCPAAKAFDLMAEARNETLWNSGISNVELKSGEPITEGTQFKVVDKRGQHDVKITAHNRPEGLSFAVHDAKMDVDIDYVLTEANGVTTMTGRFNAKGKGLMRFLLPLLVPLIRRDLAREHAHFIRLCETPS